MKEKILLTLIIIGLAFCVIMFYFSIKGNLIINKLTNLLINQKYKEFDELIENPKTNKYAKPFNIDYLKLNKAISIGKKKEIDNCFDVFEKVHMNKSQKVAVYKRAYYYYLSLNKIDKAKKYYVLLKSIDKYIGKEKIEMTYDTYVCNGYKYLDSALKTESKLKGKAKIEYDAILADMYANKNENDKSLLYRQKVEDIMKN